MLWDTLGANKVTESQNEVHKPRGVIMTMLESQTNDYRLKQNGAWCQMHKLCQKH